MDIIAEKIKAVRANQAKWVRKNFKDCSELEKGLDDELEKAKWNVGDTKVYQGVTYEVGGFNAKGTPLWKKKKESGSGDKQTQDSSMSKKDDGDRKVKKYSSFDELWRDNEKVVNKKIEELSKRKDEYDRKDQQFLKKEIGSIFNKIGIGDDSIIRLEVGKNNNFIITDYYNGGGNYIIFHNSFKKNLKETIEDISRKTFIKHQKFSNEQSEKRGSDVKLSESEKKQLNAVIKDGFLISKSSYKDVSKMSLEKTPKGNWRCYYDGKDTGNVISGSLMSRSTAKKIGLLKNSDVDKAQDDELEKGMSNEFSYSFKVPKSGRDIKKQINDVVLPHLEVEIENTKNTISELLKCCGNAPNIEVPIWWTCDMKFDIPYKIYDWAETTYDSDSYKKDDFLFDSFSKQKRSIETAKSQEEAECRRKYNDAVRKYCDQTMDIKTSEILLNQISDSKEFELTLKQMNALRFV